MTAAEVWRLILQAALALFSGVLLATLARRFTKGDKSVEEQLAFKAAQMQSEAGYRDELREENRLLREELRSEREACEDRHDKKDAYIEKLEQALRVEGRPLPDRPQGRAESA